MRFGADQTNCRSCHSLYPASDLDRYLWCPSCRKAVRKRGAVWGRFVGITAALGVAIYLGVRFYVVLGITPSSRYALFYALMLALTYLLTSRIAVAVVQGYYRSRSQRGGTDLPSD